VPGYPRPSAPIPRSIAEIAARLGDARVVDAGASNGGVAGATVMVTGITHASNEVRAGDVFAALPGARAHGSAYVPAAAAAGAVAVFTDTAGQEAAARAGLPAIVVPDARAALGPAAAAIYGEPATRLTLIGITGTAGKTSTAYLIESGLRAAGHVTGLIGTVETRLGDLVVDSVRTTPEASDLHGLFAAAVERGVTAMVMEVSSHALALDRVGGTRFAVGGYTNFGSDHLDFHRDADDYFAAKAKLFDGRCDTEILNADDPTQKPLYKPTTVTYSADGSAAATWRAVEVERNGFAQRFTAYGPEGRAVAAAVRLPGRHNVANALLAIASLVAAGVDVTVAADGVAACAGVPGRLERVEAPGPVIGVVDYAHKPDAIIAALDALREQGSREQGSSDATSRPSRGNGGGRTICLIGAGGDRDRGKRPVMGAAAARGCDLLIVTDDNPRTEDPAVVRAEILRGASAADVDIEIIEVAGRRAAIDEAVRRAAPGDIIALLGKGHERGQEINGQIHPFDDRVELAAALAARFGDRAGGIAAGGAVDGAARRADGGGDDREPPASVPAGGVA
jgi:UDP-N-acetylmuramoyl-L-alanyl-D-glutamate--2,6-diaminopimelate ligase